LDDKCCAWIFQLETQFIKIYLSPEVKWVADGYRFLEEGRVAENAELLGMYHSRNMKLNLITGADYHSRMEDIVSKLSIFPL
jgi:nicotinamide riboside kinase